MVKFHPCACPTGNMVRVHRTAWMRVLFPSRALYECGTCGRLFLASAKTETDLRLRSQAQRMSSFLSGDEKEDPSDPAKAG